MKAFILILAALLGLYAPALSQTRALPPGEIRANGDITFGNALKLGKREGNKTVITPDTLQILGSGSTGDVSATSVLPNGLTVSRTLANKFRDLPVTPQDFPNLYVGGDATAAVQQAINTALSQSRPMACHGDYQVTKVIVASQGFKLRGDCRFVGISTTPQDSVLELRAGVVSIDGALEVSANYNTNYAAAFWWNTSTQGSDLRNLSATQAKVCYKIGSFDKPEALMSELTITGGRTYGCTQVAHIIGTETYVHIIGPQWSSDAFGAPSATWAGIPFRGIVAFGSDVTTTGGELINTTQPGGYILEVIPLARANGTQAQWPRVRLNGTTVETASPIAITSNPANLTINPAGGARGLLSFSGISGFHSQDIKPLIQTSADFDGEVLWRNSRMWFPGGVRTQANIFAGSAKTDAWVDEMGFGTGFRPTISGTENGTVHHALRQILYVFSVTQALGASQSTLVFKTLDPSGDVARYSPNYNGTTGVFTVPEGGFAETEVSVAFNFPGAQGAITILQNGGRIATAPIVNGIGHVKVTRRNFPAGTTLQAFAELTTAPSGGQGSVDTNHMTISARN